MAIARKYIKPVVDFVITSFFWIYFIFGYSLFFPPLYLTSYMFLSNHKDSFQRFNHFFFRGFFFLVRTIIPRQELHIQGEVFSVRSSVIVCNHLSYLDPLLLISLFEKQKTIVKSSFYKLPVFGLLLKSSGYFPSRVGKEFASLMIENIESMRQYLLSGGNLFIFPEGTRSRDGKIGKFGEGAFKIAKICDAPIKVFFIKNTDILFRPGKFLFNTCVQNSIEIKLIGSIEADYKSNSFSISGLMEQVCSLYESQNPNLQS
jgi:1-acyl-sn-glycerol-3-phosphate acyltransferase